MKTKTIFLAACLITLSMVAIVPNAAAVLPTLDCSVTKTPSDFAVSSGITAHSQLMTNTVGQAAWMIWVRIGAADFESAIFVYDQDCNGVGQQNTNCADFTPSNDVCVFNAMDWDRLNDLWVVRSDDFTGGTPVVRNAPPPPGEACSERSGAICSLRWNITAYTNPNATGTVQPLGITTWKNTSTDQGYMIKTNQLDQLRNSFTGMAVCQPVTTGTTLSNNLTGPVGWGVGVSGATVTGRRHTFNDCATTASGTLATDYGSSSNRLERNNSVELAYVYSTSAGPQVKWTTDCLQVDLTGCQTYTPDRSQIYDTALRNTIVQDFDSDEGGSALVCGNFVDGGGETDGFVAKYDLDTKTQDWNITYDLGTSTNVYSCQFDYSGGFYLQTIFTEGGVDKQRLSHYTGGGFGVPPKDELITLPATTTPVVPAAGGAVGFRDFCAQVGFTDEPGKFLCGLIIVLSGAILVAFILADRRESGASKLNRASVFGGGGTFFGLSIFVTVIGLWPTYTTVIMIVLTAAVIMFVVKRQFAG